MVTLGDMEIEVYADIWCPFTHVGLRAVQEARRVAGRDDVRVVVHAWPLELVNGGPMEATKVHHHADDLRAQVSPDLFARIADPFPTSMLPALAVASSAYRVGLEAGERMSLALRDALFERGLDISDEAVLQRLAADHGVSMPDDTDRAAVLADWEAGKARGVVGSPHFFCGENSVFCPSLEITRDPETGLAISRNTERLSEFLSACLA